VPATITNEQREALYELVRNHLGGIDGIWIALEEDRDYAAAEQLGLELAADFRLLADIGWAPEEDRDPVRLTMPAHELRSLLGRLRAEAEAVLAGSAEERRSREEDVMTWRSSSRQAMFLRSRSHGYQRS
jgi:hypothetical protein